MSNKTVHPLFAAADAERARPILDALKEKGFRTSDKAAAELLFLSESFAGDAAAQEAFFAADSAGREIIPIDLDGAPQPELIKSALIAKNAIAAVGRTDGEIAARVASAPCFAQRKSALPKLLLAAALLLALGAGLWLWRSAQQKAPADPNAELLAAARLKYGLSEEDLAKITYVYIVSDGFYPLREDESEKTYTIFPNHSMEADGMHWTSHEDGHRIYASEWAPGDWDVLKLMDNLEGLIIVLADAGSLPDLSGLEHLAWMQVIDSRITDISGLRGSSLTYFGNFRCPIEDYSPLTRCEKLASVAMEFDFVAKADLSDFSPPALTYARFGYAPAAMELDLSGLKNCTALEEVKLDNIPCGPPDGERSPVTDLDFLAGLPNLKTLTLESMSYLRDVSALGTLKNLEYLKIEDCGDVRDVSALGELKRLRQLDIGPNERISDLSALSGCTALQALNLVGLDRVTDLSFVEELPHVDSVGALATPLRDVEYLQAVAPRIGEYSGVSVSGKIADVSGLRHLTRFNSLLIIADGRSLDFFMPWLEGAKGKRLHLSGFSDSALGALPELSAELQLDDCRMIDLRGLGAWSLEKISINGGPALRSLDGVEALEKLRDGTLSIELRDCPLLYDLSALEGVFLDELSLSGALTVPDLSGLRVRRLRLENITELTDLRCLDGLDASESVDFELVGLDGLCDLTPLRRFHGESLVVPPQLAEQAAELVESGNFQSCDVAYPEEGWVFHADGEITLLSLDELETLPGTALRQLRRLYLAGDRGVDWDEFIVLEVYAENGKLTPRLTNRRTGEQAAIETGTLTALPDLSALEELRELGIFSQSLRSLEGVQQLGSLESFYAWDCEQLTDASALFTLQGLRTVELLGCPLRSIEGVQNLTELEEIDLSHTAVDDLTPLTELPALRRVRISSDMAAAAASLEGREYRFDLIVE